MTSPQNRPGWEEILQSAVLAKVGFEWMRSKKEKKEKKKKKKKKKKQHDTLTSRNQPNSSCLVLFVASTGPTDVLALFRGSSPSPQALERRPRSISGGASPAAALSAAAEFLQGAKARVVGRVYWG